MKTKRSIQILNRNNLKAIVAIHVILLVLYCFFKDGVQYIFFNIQTVSEHEIGFNPENSLQKIAFEQELPRELLFTQKYIPQEILKITDEISKLGAINNYIYSLMNINTLLPPDFDYQRRLPNLFEHIFVKHEYGTCGHVSSVIAAILRSQNYNVRLVRWLNIDGETIHSALEIFIPNLKKWVYFDTNSNGYFKNHEDVPLSAEEAAIAGKNNSSYVEAVSMFTDKVQNNNEIRDLYSLIQTMWPWYLSDNRFLYFEPERRFGRLNFLYPFISKLPFKLDRIFDQTFGDSESRLITDRNYKTIFKLPYILIKLPVYYCLLVISLSLCTAFFVKKCDQN